MKSIIQYIIYFTTSASFISVLVLLASGCQKLEIERELKIETDSVFDIKTKTVLAHPFLPQVVKVPGILHSIKDARGRATEVELCEIALNNPKGGWVVAFVPKPGEGIIDLVYKYVLPVKNSNLAVGVNARNLRIESSLDQRAREEENILNSMLE